MKVLVISHTVFCETTNMGKTLFKYFENVKNVELAQFYIHSELPVDKKICTNYYRFTDKDAIKSIFNRKLSGKVFQESDIKTREYSRVDSGNLTKLYRKGAKRTPLTYVARNILWSMSNWKSNSFIQWVEDFNPDVIFFASGDYAFMYNISVFVANKLNKPLFIACFDDYYIFNTNNNSFLGKIYFNYFMKIVKKTMKIASKILTICDLMAESYTKLFNKSCFVMYTSSEQEKISDFQEGTIFSYIGGISVSREKQLIEIGRALKSSMADIPKYLDVFSQEDRPEILSMLTVENGIRFHGSINAKEVEEVMKRSIAVLHVESFNQTMRKRVKYSISTKIAESVSMGPCLIAYGPEEVASIDYLKRNSAAFVISDESSLQENLEIIFRDKELRNSIVNNARKLAQKNHDANKNAENFYKQLVNVTEEFNIDNDIEKTK